MALSEKTSAVLSSALSNETAAQEVETILEQFLSGAYTVASIPTAVGKTGYIAFVSNGAGGDAILAFSDGTNWLRCDTKAAIAAS